MNRTRARVAWADLSVRDVMREDVVTVDALAPARDALRLLAEHRISGMPVTDAAGGVVGVVSMRDLCEHLADRSDERPRPLVDRGEEADEDDLGSWVDALSSDDETEVKSVMSADVVAVEVGSGLHSAAEIMVRRGVHRLVVRDGDRFVGLLTATDLLRAIVDSHVENHAENRADTEAPSGT